MVTPSIEPSRSAKGAVTRVNRPSSSRTYTTDTSHSIASASAVAVFDAPFAPPGLSGYVDGSIADDVTALLELAGVILAVG
jgi:hypothetical protein